MLNVFKMYITIKYFNVNEMAFFFPKDNHAPEGQQTRIYHLEAGHIFGQVK